MDLTRRLERVNHPDRTWEESRIRDWIYAMRKSAQPLYDDLVAAKRDFHAAPRGPGNRRRLHDALVALRDWSCAEGYSDVMRETFDVLVAGIELQDQDPDRP